MKNIYRSSGCALIAALVLGVSPAALADLKWTLTSSSFGVGSSYSNNEVSDSLQVAGTQVSGSDPVTYVSVAGWADTGAPGDIGNTLAQGRIHAWGSNGLGVEWRTPNGTLEDSASPEHSTDNAGPDEFILFAFTDAGGNAMPVELKEVTIGWKHSSYDSDITVMAWNGVGTPELWGNAVGTSGYATSTNTYDYTDGAGGSSVGLAGAGWAFVGHYSNLSVGSGRSINDGTQTGGTVYTSSYWLVGAYNSRVDASDPFNASTGSYKDYIKLYSVAGTPHAPPPPPPPRVPEPGSAALMLLGLLSLRRSLRRRPVRSRH